VEKSASTIAVKKSASATAGYLLQKRLRQRKQQRIAVRRKMMNE